MIQPEGSPFSLDFQSSELLEFWFLRSCERTTVDSCGPACLDALTENRFFVARSLYDSIPKRVGEI
jgi:hypothetical protein